MFSMHHVVPRWDRPVRRPGHLELPLCGLASCLSASSDGSQEWAATFGWVLVESLDLRFPAPKSVAVPAVAGMRSSTTNPADGVSMSFTSTFRMGLSPQSPPLSARSRGAGAGTGTGAGSAAAGAGAGAGDSAVDDSRLESLHGASYSHELALPYLLLDPFVPDVLYVVHPEHVVLVHQLFVRKVISWINAAHRTVRTNKAMVDIKSPRCSIHRLQSSEVAVTGAVVPPDLRIGHKLVVLTADGDLTDNPAVRAYGVKHSGDVTKRLLEDSRLRAGADVGQPRLSSFSAALEKYAALRMAFPRPPPVNARDPVTVLLQYGRKLQADMLKPLASLKQHTIERAAELKKLAGDHAAAAAGLHQQMQAMADKDDELATAYETALVREHALKQRFQNILYALQLRQTKLSQQEREYRAFLKTTQTQLASRTKPALNLFERAMADVDRRRTARGSNQLPAKAPPYAELNELSLRLEQCTQVIAERRFRLSEVARSIEDVCKKVGSDVLAHQLEAVVPATPVRGD